MLGKVLCLAAGSQEEINSSSQKINQNYLKAAASPADVYISYYSDIFGKHCQRGRPSATGTHPTTCGFACCFSQSCTIVATLGRWSPPQVGSFQCASNPHSDVRDECTCAQRCRKAKARWVSGPVLESDLGHQASICLTSQQCESFAIDWTAVAHTSSARTAIAALWQSGTAAR